MGRKKSRSRAGAAGAMAAAARASRGGSDDELVRSELDEDEMRDELDDFELSRERALLAAGGDDGRAGRPPRGVGGGQPAPVLAFDDDDSASDAEYDQSALGVVDGEEADGDDADADEDVSGRWGKRKASYYSADYVDEDWRGATREETLEAAELEEREARAIQRRLAEQLEEDDLQFGLTAVKQPAPEAASAADVEAVQLDISRLSRTERLELLRKQCPELLPLIDEFKSRWTELSTVLNPVFKLVQAGKVAAGPGATYVTARHRLLLLYCLNISQYLCLRAERRPTATHPVLRRIAQYGKLLQTLAPADQVMAPQLSRVTQLLADGVELSTLSDMQPAASPQAPSAGRRLKLDKRRPAASGGTTSSAVDRQLAALTMEIDALEQEKARLAAEKEEAGPTFTERRQAGQVKHNPLTPFRRKERPGAEHQTGGEPGGPADPGQDDQELGPDQKRSITYQMAKNKGLMPKRNRESRNPRVKHKEKFKRALKKRRSLVRLPKKELQKYGGEVFGIRMGSVKSVAIK